MNEASTTFRATGLATRLCAAAAVALLLAACGAVPRTYFYTLRPPAGESDGTPTARVPTGYQLAIGPVSIPEYVDRPQLVIRDGPNEQRVMEQRQWVQPLAREIDSALQDDLSQLLPGATITRIGQSAAAGAAYRVAIDVQRFDSEPGREVQFSARWTLRDRNGRALESGETELRQPVTGRGYDALVAAHATALRQMAASIAASLRRQPPAGP